MRVFGENLKLSWIAAVPQDNQRPRLKLNLLEKTDKGMPSANETTFKEIAPDSMEFERAPPRILQEIWEADLVQGYIQRALTQGGKDRA